MINRRQQKQGRPVTTKGVQKVRRKTSSRMKSFVHRVLQSRPFRKFASIFGHEGNIDHVASEGQAPLAKSVNIIDQEEMARPIETVLVEVSDTASLNGVNKGGTSQIQCQSPLENYRHQQTSAPCNKIKEMDTDHTSVELHDLDISQHDDVESQGVSDTSGKPPLNARYLRVFTFDGEEGEPSSALALTSRLVWQLNTSLKRRNKIHQYKARISLVDAELNKIRETKESFEKFAANAKTERSRNSDLATVDELQEMITETLEERRNLEQKLQVYEHKLRNLTNWMFRDLSKVLKWNNLLDSEPEDSDGGRTSLNEAIDPAVENQQKQEHEQQHQHEYHLASSEVDNHAKRIEWDAAQDRAWMVSRHFNDCRYNVENWKYYHAEKHQKFLRHKEQGHIDTTQTEFDVKMLQEAQAATRQLIEAEAEFEEVKRHAKELGVPMNFGSDTSYFVDYLDDGYRESEEAAMIAHTDHIGIQRWLNEEDAGPDAPPEYDEWDARSIALGDSISVVAEGRERKHIDHWRELCALVATGDEAGVEEDE